MTTGTVLDIQRGGKLKSYIELQWPETRGDEKRCNNKKYVVTILCSAVRQSWLQPVLNLMLIGCSARVARTGLVAV